jgi:hypothetical protein
MGPDQPEHTAEGEDTIPKGIDGYDGWSTGKVCKKPERHIRGEQDVDRELETVDGEDE